MVTTKLKYKSISFKSFLQISCIFQAKLSLNISSPKNQLQESFCRAQFVMKTSATSSSQKSTSIYTICKFFNRARGCRFGEKCRYRHENESEESTRNDNVKIEPGFDGENVSENSDISDNFGTNSKGEIDSEKVIKGALVRSHDQDGAIQQQRRRPVCRYFRKSGYCRYADKCRFLHKTSVAKSDKNLNTAHEESAKQVGPVECIIKGSPVVSKKLDNLVPTGQAHVEQPVKRPEHLSEKLSELSAKDVKYLQTVEIEQLKKRFGDGNLKMREEDFGMVCVVTIKPSDPDWPYDMNEVQLNVTFPKNYPKEIFKAEVIDDDGIFPAYFTEYMNSDIEKHLKEHAEAQKLRDSPDLLFRPFLRWLDRNLENLFTKALKQIKFDIEARAAGLEFITFDNKDGGGNKEQKTQLCEISNPNDKEDMKLGLEIVKLSASQIGDDGDGDGDDNGDDKQVSVKDDASTMFEMIEARKPQNSKKGTEIRFRGLELHENTATARVTSLTFTVQCCRCKNREEMPNVKENTQVVLSCSKCSNTQSIVFTSSEVVHQYSATVAYINPQGCLPIDLILSECQLVLGCLQCSKETSIKGITYGSTKNVWCHHCHYKLDMKVEAARFHQLQPAIVSGEKIKTVELKKNTKNKDPPIKSGEALPGNGTCKHYKKSYRWMRFSCCGKCYPCDKCHEEAGDGHEMEQATRMICGFCSKEQAFSQKDCVSCKSSMTAVRTSHWEGGKGCRNRIKMSRGDDKKYSDKNKTVSKHAIKVEGQKKK